jgi:hypothetical protein
VAVTTASAVSVVPITADDARRVGEFLHAHLDERVTLDHWARAVDLPWAVDRPNAGFMLLDGDSVVGVQLAFYSDRAIDGRPERFCNLAAWCVLPAYRLHSLRLLKAVLGQEGYHFTDLSPNGDVVGINRRLGFRFLDTTTALVPNIPWPTWPGRDVISSDPALIARTLTGGELQLYQDHAATRAARHLVLIKNDEWCYVIFRKDRRKQLPLFVSVLYVSNPALFRRMVRPLCRHMLLHHGAAATLAEHRIIGYRPRFGVTLPSPRRKMFRSASLEPSQIDDLYSELVCVAW